MLIRIPHDRFAAFQHKLGKAARRVFPGFGYSPEEIERFLSLNAEPYEDTHYLFQESGEVLAVAMVCGDLLEYAIPTSWDRRYETMSKLIAALKAKHPLLRATIRDDQPSHNAWYAALLPGLGFEMTPRFRMEAPTATLLGQPPASVRSDYQIGPMHSEWLTDCVALHVTACGLRNQRAEEMAAILRNSLETEDRRASWTVALHDGEPVASSFGSHHRNRIFVEELAVAEAHRRKGLARHLLLKSVAKLAQSFPNAETVVLDVDRMSVPAVGLYCSLGFEVQGRYTSAHLRSN